MEAFSDVGTAKAREKVRSDAAKRNNITVNDILLAQPLNPLVKLAFSALPRTSYSSSISVSVSTEGGGASPPGLAAPEAPASVGAKETVLV